MNLSDDINESKDLWFTYTFIYFHYFLIRVLETIYFYKIIRK